MDELFFLVDRKTPDSSVELCGCVSRTTAHVLGFPHTTVLLLPATWDQPRNEPVVFVHKRSPVKRVSPNTWDFCGGHLSFDDWHCQYLRNSLNGSHLIERMAEDTAIREANEELKCSPEFQFAEKDIHRFKTVGYFDCNTKTDKSHNVEFSTAYVVTVPIDTDVAVWDTDREGERQLEVRGFSLAELAGEFARSEESFADGAGRILRRIVDEPALMMELSELLRTSTKPST
ncbi:MAG: NUDIX hydrolase [Armatimonadota bacterium]|nr:NUDIX hydrolase [Armatimonadota bacterium]